jgi:UDP-N-acetylglucosamine 2-epimerase (non-hydrolysing)
LTYIKAKEPVSEDLLYLEGGNQMSIVALYGTRPEAVKMIPLIKELKNKTSGVLAVNVGQHSELVEQVEKIFRFRPDFNLKIFKPQQSINSIISRTLEELGKLLNDTKTKSILVQGDTTTAMSGALYGANRRIAIAHIEAGLRSFDNSSPFPEEINRRIISVLADIHFCPTEKSRANLLNEGISTNDCYIVGNTGLDAVRIMSEGNDMDFIENSFPELSKNEYIFVTMHRRESWGDGILSVIRAIHTIASSYPNLKVFIAAHPNPLVREAFINELKNLSNVLIHNHKPYAQTLMLIKNAKFIITDSGGIQEEASFLKIPVLVARNETERMEGINSGCAKLVGLDSLRIIGEAKKLLDSEEMIISMKNILCPYGDGYAVEKIIQILQERSFI